MRVPDKYLRPVVYVATGLFFIFALLYFLPAGIPHKISFPLSVLFVFSLWLLPLPMCLAMLFSAAGDYAGSCGNFLLQMGFFALAHISIIVFFVKRYLDKVEPDRKLTRRSLGYLTMISLCVAGLLAFVFVKIVPCAPAGIIRAGVGTYSVIISAMLFFALLQRSSFFALGAILFVFSDFILAWNKFVEPLEYERYLIMVPYYLGQWLLFVRSTKYRIKSGFRLHRL